VKSGNFCPLAIEKNSAHQFVRECRLPSPIQCHLVFLIDFVTRVGEPLRKVAIIREKKQTFGLRVQTANIE
jgi:hypothetical protein